MESEEGFRSYCGFWIYPYDNIVGYYWSIFITRHSIRVTSSDLSVSMCMSMCVCMCIYAHVYICVSFLWICSTVSFLMEKKVKERHVELPIILNNQSIKKSWHHAHLFYTNST